MPSQNSLELEMLTSDWRSSSPRGVENVRELPWEGCRSRYSKKAPTVSVWPPQKRGRFDRNLPWLTWCRSANTSGLPFGRSARSQPGKLCNKRVWIFSWVQSASSARMP